MMRRTENKKCKRKVLQGEMYNAILNPTTNDGGKKWNFILTYANEWFP